MKKLLALLLAAVIAVTGAVSAFALIQFPVTLEGELSDYPVVIVPGYIGARLYLGDDPETAECAWSGFNVDQLLPHVLQRIAELAAGAAVMPLDRADHIAAAIVKSMHDTWPYLGCNPDGSSRYPLRVFSEDAAVTNDAALRAAGHEDLIHEVEITATLAGMIGEENIYSFNADWRMGAEACAARLNAYIESVKAHSGKEKVNVFALSHGGQVAATYLTLYGEQGDVNNAVLSSPAIGGAGIAYDLLAQQVHFDEQTLIKLIEVGTFTEEDYEWLVKAVNLGFVDQILNAMVTHLSHSLGYWGSIWDFIPTEKYEALKAKYLSAPESAPLAAQSDRFHYEILPQIGEKLRACNENGMHVSIITGSGNRVVTGWNVNSDGIIPVVCATGAVCAPYGERFADGYTPADRLSPAMEIDASTCYLPDNTWFSDGNFHAWTYWTPCTRTLSLELLMTDRIRDVHSDPRYPQFLTSDHVSYAVDFSFDGAPCGAVNGGCRSVTVRNTCDKATVRITGLYAKEAPLAFRLGAGITLAPGESVSVPFTGALPDGPRTVLHLTVCYAMSNVTPLSFRTKGFTLDGTDEAQGGTVAVNAYPFPDGVNRLLERLGLRDYLALLLMHLISLMRSLSAALPIS